MTANVLESLVADGREYATRARLTDGPSEGVEVVTLKNDGFEVDVCPTRGMGILDIRSGEDRIGWDSPVLGPVHPSLVNLESRNGLGWLEGFTELFVRCGLSYVGPPGADEEAGPIAGDITLHGRIANLPAGSVEVGHDEAGVFARGVVTESVLFGPQLRLTTEIRLTPDNRVVVRDEITNFGPAECEYEVLYHINVGPPILAGGTRVCVDAIEEVCPRDPRAAEDVDTWSECLPPTDGYAEQAYFFKPSAGANGRTTASLVAPGGKAFSVEYDPVELPCLTLWKCTQSEEAGYVVGLEPGTNYPNHKSFERAQGRVPVLAAGETDVKTITMSLAEGVSPGAPTESLVIHERPVGPMAVE